MTARRSLHAGLGPFCAAEIESWRPHHASRRTMPAVTQVPSFGVCVMNSRTLSRITGSLKRLVVRRAHAEHLELGLRDLFRTMGVDLALDIGANRGQFGALLRDRIGFDGDIISFEPIPAVARALAAEVEGDARWRVLEIGLGDEDSEQLLHVARETVFSSLLPPSEFGLGRFHRGIAVAETIGVPIRRLDSVLPRLVPDFESRVAHLKIDTQGFDLHVVRGAGDLIRRFVSIQVEVGLRPSYTGAPAGTDLMAAIVERGFDLVGMYPVVRDGLRLVDADALFVNRDAVAIG